MVAVLLTTAPIAAALMLAEAAVPVVKGIVEVVEVFLVTHTLVVVVAREGRGLLLIPITLLAEFTKQVLAVMV